MADVSKTGIISITVKTLIVTKSGWVSNLFIILNICINDITGFKMAWYQIYKNQHNPLYSEQQMI